MAAVVHHSASAPALSMAAATSSLLHADVLITKDVRKRMSSETGIAAVLQLLTDPRQKTALTDRIDGVQAAVLALRNKDWSDESVVAHQEELFEAFMALFKRCRSTASKGACSGHGDPGARLKLLLAHACALLFAYDNDDFEDSRIRPATRFLSQFAMDPSMPSAARADALRAVVFVVLMSDYAQPSDAEHAVELAVRLCCDDHGRLSDTDEQDCANAFDFSNGHELLLAGLECVAVLSTFLDEDSMTGVLGRYDDLDHKLRRKLSELSFDAAAVERAELSVSSLFAVHPEILPADSWLSSSSFADAQSRLCHSLRLRYNTETVRLDGVAAVLQYCFVCRFLQSGIADHISFNRKLRDLWGLDPRPDAPPTKLTEFERRRSMSKNSKRSRRRAAGRSAARLEKAAVGGTFPGFEDMATSVSRTASLVGGRDVHDSDYDDVDFG